MNSRTPVAYMTVAGFCLVLHNVILIASDSIGIPLWLAVLLSFTAVASSGYVLHAIFTFRQPLAVSRFARYAFAMSANIPLAFVTTWLWHVPVGLSMPLAAPIASGCMLAVNYLLGRWAIVPPPSSAAELTHGDVGGAHQPGRADREFLRRISHL